VHLEETLKAQRAVLAQLSTPPISISDDVIVLPLVGTIDSQRAQEVMAALLEGIAQTRAQVVILDITGEPVVDTQGSATQRGHPVEPTREGAGCFPVRSAESAPATRPHASGRRDRSGRSRCGAHD
jgi:hypothetical protein